MSKRDLSRLSESKQPRALFRKRKRHPVLAFFLFLLVLTAVVVILGLLGLLDMGDILRSVANQ